MRQAVKLNLYEFKFYELNISLELSIICDVQVITRKHDVWNFEFIKNVRKCEVGYAMKRSPIYERLFIWSER